MTLNQLQTGVQVVGDGATVTARAGKLGDAIVSELHGRFYEQNYRGNIFTGGLTTLTSISNVTFTTATSGVTATPVIGLYNPATNTKNLVLIQALLSVAITASTNTGCGGFVWAYATGQNAISTGATPINAGSLLASGSNAKVLNGVAVTGMTGSLSLLRASALNGGSAGNFSFVGTAVGQVTSLAGADTENFDGSLIIPPGGVLGLFATSTPVAHSAVAGMAWEEVPV
jgi:hypothetical protein